MWDKPGPVFPDERGLDAPTVPMYVWNKLDAIKAENHGWVVLEGLTTKELRKLISEGFFKAVEADDCPVRLVYPKRIINWPLSVTEVNFKQWLWLEERAIMADQNNTVVSHQPSGE